MNNLSLVVLGLGLAQYAYLFAYIAKKIKEDKKNS